MKFNSIFRKNNFGFFIFLSLSFLVGISTITFVIFNIEKKSGKEILKIAEINKLELQYNEVINDFSFVKRDVRLLRDLVAQLDQFSCSEGKSIELLRNDFYHFILQKQIYDQIRFLNEDGFEVLRINYNNGKPVIVADEDLQDKSSRYYFGEMKGLLFDEIYFSRFDLNVENGKVEIPFKPTIRVGTRIKDCEGNFCGMVLVNYLGKSLIEKVESLNTNSISDVHMVENQGYILASPDSQNNWGFMFTEGGDKMYQKFYPDAWPEIDSIDHGQLFTGNGLFTFKTIRLGDLNESPGNKDLEDFVHNEYWKIISYVSKDKLDHLNAEILSKFYLPVGFIAFLSLFLSLILTFLRIRNRQTEVEMLEHNRFLSGVVSAISEPLYVVCPKSHMVFMANGEAMKYSIEIGKNFFKNTLLNSPDHRKNIEGFRELICNSKKYQKIEITLPEREGPETFLEMNGYPILDDKGEVVQIVEVVEDVTVDRLSERKFKDLLASAPDGMIITNREGKIEMVNKQAEKLFGYATEELIGKEIELLIPKRLAGHSQHRATFVGNPMAREMGVGKELKALKKNGKEFPVEISLSPIQTAEGLLISSAIRDVTKRKIYEQRIVESERKFRALFNNQSQFIGLLETDGTIIEVNKTALAFGGLTLEQVKGKKIWETSWWSVSEAAQNELKEAVGKARDGEYIRYEVNVLGEGGSEITVDFSLQPVKDENGRVILLIPEGRDITAKKEIEQELFSQAQILDQVFEAVMTISLDGVISTWNHGAKILFGYTAEEIIGKHLSFLCPKEEHEIIYGQLYEEFNGEELGTPNEFSIENLGKAYNLMIKSFLDKGQYATELRKQKKSGEVFTGYLSLSSHKDSEGKVIGVIGSVIDISDRIEAQKELERKQELLNEAQKVAHMGSWEWDPIRNKVTWSDEVFNIFGVDQATFKETIEAYIGFVTEDDVDRIIESMQESLRDPKESRTEHKIRLNDGTIKHLALISNVETGHKGEIIRLFGITQDITEQKNAQIELEKKQLLLSEAQKIAKLGSWEWDIGQDKLIWSDELYNIFGLDPNTFELTYEAYLKLLDEEDARIINEIVAKAIENKSDFQFEHKIRFQDGTIKHVDCSGNVGLDNTNTEVVRLYGTALDVTSRKRAEAEIRKLNEDLEQKVIDRTQKLENANKKITRNERKAQLLKEIASNANAADSVDLAFNVAIRKFTEYIDWSVGHVYIFDETENILIPTSVWYCEHESEFDDFIEETKKYRFKPSEGLPGEVMSRKTSVYYEDVKSGDTFIRTRNNKDINIRSAFASPVIVRDKVVAVLEFFNSEVQVKDDSILDIAERIGIELGYVIARKNAERAVKESEGKFRQLAENIEHVLWLTSGNQMLYVSPSFERLFGGKVEDIYNNPASFLKLVHPKDLKYFLKTYENASAENSNFEMEFRAILPNNEIRWIHARSFSFVTDSEEDRRSVGIAEDITEFRKLNSEIVEAKEEAEKASRAKSEFLANMSHEIRTPMNSIIGFTELLSKFVSGDKQVSYLNSIKTSTKSLLTLINDILDLSKVESGKLELQPEATDLKALIKEVEQIFLIKAEQKEIVISISCNEDFPQYIEIDETRVRQIMFNLVGNAIKFTEKGAVSIILDKVKHHKKSNSLDFELIIKDTGIGIPEDQQESIFESFKQQEGQSIKKYEGTGLGLAITKRLVEVMNGTIRVESEPGKGSSFIVKWIDIPILRMKEISENREFDINNYKFDFTKILVVDDNDLNRELIREAFASDMIEIFEAENGYQALEMVTEINPDLILMDIRMPVMNGIEASKKVREMRKFKNIPIIALTASGMRKDLDHIKDEQFFNEILLKPVAFKELIDTMSKYINIIELDLQKEENKTHVQKINYKITDRVELADILDELNGSLMDLWGKASEGQIVEDIEDFARQLSEFENTYKLGFFNAYTESLLKMIDEFDIENLSKQLKKYPQIIYKIKKENIEDNG